MPNVSFMAPGSELELAQQDATRQRALADALRQQSMTPSQGVQAGAMYVAPSWTQGLARLLQGYKAGKISDKTDADLRTARSQYDTRTQGEVAEFVKNLRGTPAQTFQTGANEMGDDAATQSVAAQAPDMNKAMMTALSSQNPMIQSMGGNILSSQVASDMTMQRMAAALKQFGIAPPGSPAASATDGAAGAPAGAVPGAAAPGGGGIPGVSGLAAALIASGDPSLKALGEAAQTAYAKGNEPVINRGYGIGRMVNGQYVPDAASLEQALAMERGKVGITAPLETPVSIDLSGGQKAQLSRPEYAEFQKTGQLPARYGQGAPSPAPAASVQPEPGVVGKFVGDPAQVRKAIAAIKSPQERANAQAALDQQMTAKGGLGVAGLTQSQPDQVEQAGQMKFADQVASKSADSLLESRDKARTALTDLASVQEARTAVKAGAFQSTGADSKLAITKFINANIPGVEIDAKKAGNTDYLKSLLGTGLLAQAKTLGSNPSNADAQRINDIVGSIDKDPQAMAKILDWREMMAKRVIDMHNGTVEDAETRGMKSPFDLRVKPPQAKAAAAPAVAGGFRIIGVK